MNINKNLSFYLIIFFSLIYHLLFIGLETVNFENSFSQSIFYIVNYDIKILENYFDNNANTLGFSFIGFFLFKLLPFVEPSILLKFISATGYIFLGFGIKNFYNNLRLNISLDIILIILFFNPLIWTFGFRGTPDFFAFSLAFFSISNLIFSRNSYSQYLNSIFFGFAVLIKFHAGFLYILYFLLSVRNLSLKNTITLFINSFLISLPLLLYLIYIYIQFGFFLTSPTFQTYHITDIMSKSCASSLEDCLIKDTSIKPTSNFFFSSLFQYLGFSVLFYCIFFIFDNIKSILSFKKLFYLSFSFAFYLLLVSFFSFKLNFGEMDFGPFSNVINNNFIIYLLATLSYLSFLSIYFIRDFIFTKSSYNYLIFILYILLYIFFLSFFRPTQRYLIYIIPFVIFIYFSFVKPLKFSIILYVLFFISVNLLLQINHLNTSSSIKKISEYLDSNNLFTLTHPGSLNPHIRHKFEPNNLSYIQLLNGERKYIVSNKKKDDSIVCFDSDILNIFKKTFCLNPL